MIYSVRTTPALCEGLCERVRRAPKAAQDTAAAGDL